MVTHNNHSDALAYIYINGNLDVAGFIPEGTRHVVCPTFKNYQELLTRAEDMCILSEEVTFRSVVPGVDGEAYVFILSEPLPAE